MFEQTQESVRTFDSEQSGFNQFKEQVIIDITATGLRIQIVDKDQKPIFDSGSAELESYSNRSSQPG